MEPEDIKIEFFKRRRQVMMKDVAAKVGVTPAAITRVIDRQFKSRRIAEAIADALERPIAEVFPEWYGCDDQRNAACN
jgi:lambda repressor-like predicted transcriptional regulator